MSGYLQYSNYGDDEKPPSTQPQQPQHKRTLRTNQRTLRSKQHTQAPSQPPIQRQVQSQNQTQNPNPNQNPQNKYAQQDLIQKIHNAGSDSDSDYDTNETTDYSSMQKQFQTEPVFNHNMYSAANSADLNARLNPAPAKEGFASKTLANAVPHQYPQYMPSVFQASNGATDNENKDFMLQKLDHIISLLEDQHDAKTGHVTEELVLYCFLGVFIIFIVDSFARAGKYVR